MSQGKPQGKGLRDGRLEMDGIAICGDGHRMIGRKIFSALSVVLILAGLCGVLEVYAEDLKSASDHLAEQSFALLDRLSQQDGGKPNPLLGPVASFAGDADSLRHSLAISDLRSANSGTASLRADAIAVEQALKQHPDAKTAEQWRALRQQADKLAEEIPACRAHSGCGPPVAMSGSRAASGTDAGASGYAPRIVIASRESGSGIVRLKGYFEGRGLKSAGIYEGSSWLKAFKVDGISGRQRVEFDLRLEDPSAATILRVSDAEGRTAEAPVLDPSLQPTPPTAEISSDSTAMIAPPGSSEPLPDREDDSGAVEVPSHGPLMPSPSKRHTLGSKLGEVWINILNVTRTGNLPPTYEIVGEIRGRGITRAGIYLDGRLLQRIPIIDSASYTSFDQRFVAEGGSMTIRAYSVGNQFIEQPVVAAGISPYRAIWPDSAYSGEGNYPFGTGLSTGPHGNNLGAARPPW